MIAIKTKIRPLIRALCDRIRPINHREYLQVIAMRPNEEELMLVVDNIDNESFIYYTLSVINNINNDKIKNDDTSLSKLVHVVLPRLNELIINYDKTRIS